MVFALKKCRQCLWLILGHNEEGLQRIRVMTQNGFHPLLPMTAELPLDHVAIDLFGPLSISTAGYAYGLDLTDNATRFLCLVPLKDNTAEFVAHALFP